jgi:hypothetical protein
MHSPHIRQEYLQTSRVENYETKKNILSKQDGINVKGGKII